MEAPRRFIIVDDDNFVITYCRMLISKAFPRADIKCFTEPETGLLYLQHGFEIEEYGEPAILFLDINMPTMTGWDFLKKFENFNEHLKNSIQVYILSSSVDNRDKERGLFNKNVVDYIVKPLDKEFLRLISQTDTVKR